MSKAGWAFAAVVLGFLLAAPPARAAAPAAKPTTPAAKPALPAFQSEAELKKFLKKVSHRHRRYSPGFSDEAAADVGGLQTVVVTGVKAPASITNNQEQGVDEGDIVKLRGDTLIVLRRGRLFTVSIAGGAMRPVDSINAYPPGVDAGADWYDEMLVAQNRIVVIGYSYGRGGTEVNRFDLDAEGHLKWVDAYHLRSNDYYSSRNYASRMIGHRLVLYSPLYLAYANEDPMVSLPALRRWSGDPKAGFGRINTARQVYLSPGVPDDLLGAVHTVIDCDVLAPVMTCKATSVIGPEGRVFYVSQTAVYVWTAPDWPHQRHGNRASSVLYRLPLNGSAPAAIAVRGAPIDQFSFQEEYGRNVLDVLVSAESRGDAMWHAERREGDLALAYIDLDSLGDGTQEIALSHYRPLPNPTWLERNDWALHNRFVGDYLLYGGGKDWGRPEQVGGQLIAVAVHGTALERLILPHAIDRIEPLGRDAVVVGSSDKSLYFSAVKLRRGAPPALGDRYVLTDASESETRSHAFFFNPGPGSADDGVLGLPVARAANPAYHQLFETSAAILFLRRAGGKFAPLGELASHPETAVDDRCVASCVDWYGNARPIFVGGRTFALMGYELVEGTTDKTAIRETGRASFAPEKK